MNLKSGYHTRNPLRAAMRGSLLAATLIAATLPLGSAFADDNDLEEIVVTGSILKRTDAETPSPVTVLSAETLEERGINTIAEAVQRLTANNAGTITSGWNTGFNFASGAVAPALRGLTVQATLSVVDGLRMAPYPLADDGQRNFVDLSTVPDAIIDRIEVLRDGASSTYGADAIAGVVNVITKKEIQGLHFGGSTGIDQRGDAPEQRADITFGVGDLASQGYNFYVSGEYQRQGDLWARDRQYPFNSANLSKVCGSSGSCMYNLDWNGVTAEDGTFNGLISVPGVTLVQRLYTPGTVSNPSTQPTIRYEYLNPSAGCREWPTITQTASASAPTNICEVDFQNAYIMLQPRSNRIGLATHFTANLGDSAQFYASANYYKTDTFASFTPLGFNGTPTPPTPAGLAAYNVIQPIYVCSTGVGTLNGINTGCTAANGTLNPYNPYAAAGFTARTLLRSPNGRTIYTSAESLHAIVGVEGDFGGGWHYKTDFTGSEVGLTRTESNYLIPQRIMDVVAKGKFNFADPYANSKEIWDYIAPESTEYSPSKLWQLQSTLSKAIMDLPGGPLQAAVGASYREESIDAPSANPGDDSAPYTRYYSINSVGTAGARNVKSGFFEMDAPVLKQLDLLASGRYDKYSTGQSNFSPKLGFKFKPEDAIAFRGTWSKGFRIPSFNEAFGLPTTGYVNRTINCATYTAFCAAHGATSGYVTLPYSLGLTSIGNPGLDPEKSTSFTSGIVVEPMQNVSFTVDYWRIKVKNLITSVTSTQAAEDAYYLNNGVVNIPGITVIPGNADPNAPNALPLLGFIQSSFANQDQQTVSGIDLGANFVIPIGAVKLRSTIDASYLASYVLKTDAGDVLRYDGTLSPCNITSCSGAPKWRASWQNTLEFGKATVSLTTYFTGGYDLASVDYGGVPGDCDASEGASVVQYVDGTNVLCRAKPTWNADLTASYKLTDKVMIKADVLNVFDIKAPFEPSAAYSLFQFNPAWAGPNILGRFFRIGAKVDL